MGQKDAVAIRDSFDYPQDYDTLGYCSHAAKYVNQQFLDKAIAQRDQYIRGYYSAIAQIIAKSLDPEEQARQQKVADEIIQLMNDELWNCRNAKAK